MTGATKQLAVCCQSNKIPNCALIQLGSFPAQALELFLPRTAWSINDLFNNTL